MFCRVTLICFCGCIFICLVWKMLLLELVASCPYIISFGKFSAIVFLNIATSLLASFSGTPFKYMMIFLILSSIFSHLCPFVSLCYILGDWLISFSSSDVSFSLLVFFLQLYLVILITFQCINYLLCFSGDFSHASHPPQDNKLHENKYSVSTMSTYNTELPICTCKPNRKPTIESLTD